MIQNYINRCYKIRNIIIISLLIIICPIQIIAADLSLKPEFSYSNELYSDFLYSQTGKLNSRLDYTPAYLFKTGIEFGLEAGNFDFNFDSQFGLPLKCGTLYDSDWKTENIKTDLSIHDLWSIFSTDFSINTKYNFSINNFFELSPVLDFTFNYRSFSAKQGTAYKGSIRWTGLDQDYSWDSEYAVQKKVYGIDYFSNIFSIYTGISFNFRYLSNLISFKSLISPFSYCLAVDHHLNSEDGHYYQMIQTGFFNFFKFNIEYAYYLKNESKLVLGIDFNFSSVTPGELYYGYFAIDNIIADETSAFSVSKFSITISYDFKINKHLNGN